MALNEEPGTLNPKKYAGSVFGGTIPAARLQRGTLNGTRIVKWSLGTVGTSWPYFGGGSPGGIRRIGGLNAPPPATRFVSVSLQLPNQLGGIVAYLSQARQNWGRGGTFASVYGRPTLAAVYAELTGVVLPNAGTWRLGTNASGGSIVSWTEWETR